MEEHKNFLGEVVGRKAELAVYLLLSVILVTASLFGTGKTVTLVEGDQEVKLFTFSRTVDELIDEAGIQLNPQDRLLPAGETDINNGQVIIVNRAMDITVLMDGREYEYWTHTADVVAFLFEKGIILGEGDHVNPGFTEELRAGQVVEVTRASVEYPIVPHIREYGENTMFSRGGRTFELARVFEVEATAYCPGTPGSGCPLNEHGHAHCTGHFNDGYTYTGDKAVQGDGSLENPHIIAVDPSIIPIYSLVYLEGYGFARALDRGGAIKGMTIDLLFDRHADAIKFGRRQVKLYFLHD